MMFTQSVPPAQLPMPLSGLDRLAEPAPVTRLSQIELAPPALHRRISTPQGLCLGFLGICATTTLMVVTTISSTRHHKALLQQSNQLFLPSLAASQQIQESLAALDANLTQTLLADQVTVGRQQALGQGLPDSLSESQQAFEQHRQKITNALLQLSQLNLHPSDEEQRLMTLLQTEFGQYLMLSAQAQGLQEAADQEQRDLLWMAYRESFAQLETRLLPAAIALQSLETEGFMAKYQSGQTSLRFNQKLLLVLGSMQLLGLLQLQRFLSDRTHRTLNPALLLATILTLLSVLQASYRLGDFAQQLQQITATTTEILQPLGEARSLAFLTHSQIGQQLLLASSSSQLGQQPNSSLAQEPLGSHDSYRKLLELIRSNSSSWKLSGASQQSVSDLRQAMIHYQEAMRRVQSLKGQDLEAAIALATGYRSGQLNAVFEMLKDRHHSVLDVQQAVVNQSISDSLDRNQAVEKPVAWIGLVVIGLIGIGLYPRWKEYTN